SRINKAKVRSQILEHARGFMYEDLLQHIGDTSFNLSFIVEAFLCNYISKNILLDPFVVFGELHDDQGMYLRLMEEAMLKSLSIIAKRLTLTNADTTLRRAMRDIDLACCNIYRL